ncbi:MAG TPA: acylphosphatase [Deltaproteobacteria bacterium]|nr:acylphosphatase [Deltaproteobacteria bacterium]HQI81997.1 acylphosphatase [Deltaproteobacteria bacterium]
MKALHLMIHGRVQGVWFRASTQEAAHTLKIRGWVRNAPDGSVEAHIQGDDRAVEEMVAWCRTGPPGARVDAVDIHETNPVEEYRSFTIRYY